MKLLYAHFPLAILLSLFVIAPANANTRSGASCPVKVVKVKNTSWRMTGASCPSGRGLWDRKPNNPQGTFWIQCGYTNGVPPAWFAKMLGEMVAENRILLKKENENYRCLIGPFNRINEANSMRDRLRNEPELKSVFVREVQDGRVTVKQTMPKKQDADNKILPKPVDKTVAPLPITPIDDFDDDFTDTTAKKEAVSESNTDKKVMNRDFYQIGNLYSPTPKSRESHYFEGNKRWLRATFKEANNICNSNGMDVVDVDSLRAAATKPKEKSQLPKRLPYWVKDRVAFDIVMMVPISLTENSSIYVFCK